MDRKTQKYIINEYEAEAVRLIFRMYLDGYSYTEIIDTLNSRGYRTRKGIPFAKNSLYAILRNERYTGVYIYVKDSTKNPKGKYVRHGEYDPDAVIRIPGGIPAIISEDDFHRVQAKMKERQHKAAKFSAKQEYLLSGKIYTVVSVEAPMRAILANLVLITHCIFLISVHGAISVIQGVTIPRSIGISWSGWYWNGCRRYCLTPTSSLGL